MDLEEDTNVIQIRAKLNQQKIKLWELPYYNSTTKNSVEQELEKLANTFHKQLDISLKDCLNVIQKLQQNALNKLQSKDEFIKSGIATLRIRAPTQKSSDRFFEIKIKTTEKAEHLVQLLVERLRIDKESIKLVCAGKVLSREKTLQEQNVANGATVMLLIVQNSSMAQKESDTFDRVHKIRADAEIIIKDNEQFDFLSLEDQDGNALHLPKEEKKALLMALTIYEKGKAALRKANYEEALLLFLEADSDFRSCNSQLLAVVDNYALLNLDILWCYLCLKNINQLPDAEQRIKICEEKFRQSYGENMRRVTAIKGTQYCSEKALLLRLHLLKAVLYFHQNKQEESKIMFNVVETELQSLQVDDACLTTLLDCGFEISESRIALRACSNSIEAAIEFINNRKQVVAENEKKSKREKNLYKKIGHNKSEEVRINVDRVDQLVEMGYPESLAAIALKNTNNDIMQALNELQNNEKTLKTELMKSVEPCEKLVNQLVDLGFDEKAAYVVLKHTINNFDDALEKLVNSRQNDNYNTLLKEYVELSKPENCTEPNNHKAEDNLPEETGIQEKEEAGPSRKRSKSDCSNAKKEMMDILFKSFSKDIDTNNDTYLDLPILHV